MLKVAGGMALGFMLGIKYPAVKKQICIRKWKKQMMRMFR